MGSVTAEVQCDENGFRVFGPGNFPDDVGIPFPDGGKTLSSDLFFTPEKCRTKCVANDACLAYAYNGREKKCRTFSFASRCGITSKKRNGRPVDYNFW